MSGTYQSDLKLWLKRERVLASRLDGLCGRVNRLEDLDEESRAELYTILRALERGAEFKEVTLAASAEGGNNGV